MADPFLAQSDLDRTLEALPSPGSVTQTPGLSGLAPSLADLSVMQQRMLGEISALGRGGTAQQPVIQQNIAYSPSTKKYWVNDTLVDTGDIASMLQGASRATAPGQPAPGNVARDWVPVTQQDFNRTVAQLRQPRGFGENVGLGFAGAAEGIIGGVGRTLELMGAPSVGKPIAEFAESTFGQSEYNKQRDALIQQSNSLFSNIMDAVYRGVPSVGVSALFGGAGALGGAALATRAGLSAARGAAVGAGAGAGAAVFPSEVQGLYEAAQKGGYNVEDPGVQNEILGAALGSSILQTIVPAYAGKAFASPILQRRSREIAEEVIRKQAGSRAVGIAGAAAGASLTEALAEGTAALIQQAAFDPEFRSKLSKEDLKALVPFIADKYGENIVIAMGAGAILGAGFGGAGKFLGDRPVDMTKVAEEKSVAEEAAQAAPAETTALPPPQPPATTDEILASAWEQSARMAMQPAQLGLAPYGENPALGAAWERAVAKPAGPVGLSITSEAAASPPVDLAALLSGGGALPAPTAAFVSPTYVSPTGAVGTQAAPYVAPPPVRGVQETFVPSAQPAPTPTAAAAPARVEFAPPVAEAPYGNVPAFQPIPQVSFPGSTKAERDAAFEAAGRSAPTAGPMAGQLAPLASRLRAQGAMTKVEPRLAATEQQAAAAREAGAYAQRTDAEIDADTLADTLVPNFMILTDKAQDRWRAAVADIDADTRTELIGGDPTTLAGRQAMDQLTRVADDIRRSISPKKRAAAAEPATQTQREPNAAPEGQKSEGGLRERTDADKGGPPPKASRGDSLKQGGQKQAAKPASEVDVSTTFNSFDDLQTRIDSGKDTIVYRGVRYEFDEDGNLVQGNQEAGYFWSPNYEVASGYARTAAFGGVEFGPVYAMRIPSSVLAAAQRADTEVSLEGLSRVVALRQGILADEGVEFVIPPKLHGKRVELAGGLSLPELRKAVAPVRTAKPVAQAAPEVTPAPAPTPASDTDRELALLEKQLVAFKAGLLKAKAASARKDLQDNIAQTEARIRELKGETPAPTPAAAPTPAPAAAPTRGLTPDAVELLAKVDAGGVPGMMTKSLRAIAAKNGVEVTPTMKPADVIAALRAKQDGAPEAPTRPPAGAAETPSTTAAPAPQPETEAEPSKVAVEPVATASTETRTEVEQSADAARKKELLADLAKIRQSFINARTPAELDRLRAERDALESELSRVEDRLAPKSVGKAKIGAALVVDAANETQAKYEAARPLEIKHRQLRQTANELVKRGTLSKADAEKLKQTRAELKKVEAELAATPSTPVAYFSLVGFNTVTGAIDYDGKPIARPMAEGRVRMAVRDLLSKLSVKPNVRIFKDQADLKARDPALYRQAVAGRPQGDFDTANAAGYSFGDNRVIIFSNRIANDRHLRFVVAHETIGHMGLRALMPANKFDPFMESLYDANPRIQGAVDAAMTNRDLSKAEAVEEYLADYAGLLETSMVRRVWDAIKGGLNKIGVKFGDEAARYWLDQAKRYVRTGEAALFDAAAIAERLQAVETGQVGPGRFSIAGIRNDQQKIIDAVYNAGLPSSIGEGMADLRRLGGSIDSWWDQFKGKYLSLANYRARNNSGLTIFEQIQSEMSGLSQEVIRRFADRLTPILDSPTAGKASEAVYNMRAFANAKAADEPVPTGTPLFTIDKNGEPQVKAAEVNALFNKHLPTLKELQDGVTLTFKDRVEDREITRTVEIPADKTLTKEAYDEAVALRRMMADIEVEVLRERIKSRLEADEIAYKAASRIMKTGEFTADERRFVVDTARKAKGFIGDMDTGPGQSDRFLAAVNEAILAKGFDEKKTDPLRAFFDDPKQADTYIERLKNFRKNVAATDTTKFILQNKVREIIAADVAFDRHTRAVKRSLVNGYVPVMRTGSKQVRVAALVDGKPVTLAPEWQDALVLSHFEGEGDAQKARESLNASFKGKTIEALVLDTSANSENGPVYKPMQVALVARVGDVLEVPATDPRTNLDDFLSVMRRLNINLTPAEMERVITTLTATTDAARRRLMFSNTPGYDRTSAPASVAKHIQGRASTIGKLYAIPKMDQLLDRDGEMFKYWTGNREGVMALKEQLDGAKTDAERTRLRRALDLALYQYKQTNLGADKWDGSRKSAPPEDQITRDRVNRYYNESVRTLDSIVSARSLTESEFENKRGISELRAGASIMYLGLSVSNGLLNLASVQTNWLPYMASHNAKNGFGGGFGVGRAQVELLKAMKQVGGVGAGKINFRTAEYFDRVAGDQALLKKHGLTKVEAEFIAEQTRRGVMVPAESNALLSTALGRENRPYLRKFVDTVMYPFNVTEQAARRAAGLAAFRLEYDRQIAAGVSAKDAAATASDFAAQSLKLTLGEYNVLNRPPAWRQGLPGLLYTFKTYPTTTIQLLRNLSPKGQTAMLAMLWMMSGVAGFPLAEDVEDIVDTVAQKLGIRWSGGRIELAKLLDEVMPGVSPYVLKGVVTEFMGLSIDLGAKFSMGDVIPGTGIFLAGAKPQEELLDLLGPVASAGIGMLGMARDIVTFPFSSTKTLEDVARNSPMTFLRTLGDASAYLNTGAIVDRRGYVVSNELTTGTIIGRLMGFYPKEAADQYDIIKYMNRTVNYQKEMTAGFRQAWIKAKLRGDEETAATIQANAADWNDATRGTALEMRDWLAGSQRALREAKRPAVERTLRATPQASRQDLAGYANLLVD